MQHRLGPNHERPLGLLQALADGMKLRSRRTSCPPCVDKRALHLAPIIAGRAAFMAFAVIPFGR